MFVVWRMWLLWFDGVCVDCVECGLVFVFGDVVGLYLLGWSEF